MAHHSKKSKQPKKNTNGSATSKPNNSGKSISNAIGFERDHVIGALIDTGASVRVIETACVDHTQFLTRLR